MTNEVEKIVGANVAAGIVNTKLNLTLTGEISSFVSEAPARTGFLKRPIGTKTISTFGQTKLIISSRRKTEFKLF